MLRVIAGPDGIDPYVPRDADRRPGRDVSIAGMKILLSEDTSYINVSPRAARRADAGGRGAPSRRRDRRGSRS